MENTLDTVINPNDVISTDLRLELTLLTLFVGKEKLFHRRILIPLALDWDLVPVRPIVPCRLGVVVNDNLNKPSSLNTPRRLSGTKPWWSSKFYTRQYFEYGDEPNDVIQRTWDWNIDTICTDGKVVPKTNSRSLSPWWEACFGTHNSSTLLTSRGQRQLKYTLS